MRLATGLHEATLSVVRPRRKARRPAGTGRGTVQEYVERGQLLTLKVDNWAAVYAD
jgi:hypothetical protein